MVSSLQVSHCKSNLQALPSAKSLTTLLQSTLLALLFSTEDIHTNESLLSHAAFSISPYQLELREYIWTGRDTEPYGLLFTFDTFVYTIIIIINWKYKLNSYLTINKQGNTLLLVFIMNNTLINGLKRISLSVNSKIKLIINPILIVTLKAANNNQCTRKPTYDKVRAKNCHPTCGPDSLSYLRQW